MDDWTQYVPRANAWAYFGLILLLPLIELLRPWRDIESTVKVRWVGNVGVGVLNAVLVRLLFPFAGLAWAMYCRQSGWGFFAHVAAPWWVEGLVTIAAIDFVHYARHYCLHRSAMLWRIHAVHHSDHACDVATGVRVHPLESVSSVFVLLGTVFLLGAPVWAVALGDLITATNTLIEHSNIRVPKSLDRVLRWVLVTPDLHRVHHSQAEGDSQSNFATAFSFWDRMFGTYRATPAVGSDAMVFGLAEFSDRKYLNLRWMLAQPFLRQSEVPPIVTTITGVSETTAS